MSGGMSKIDFGGSLTMLDKQDAIVSQSISNGNGCLSGAGKAVKGLFEKHSVKLLAGSFVAGGAVIGGVLGGPLGAVVGAVVGVFAFALLYVAYKFMASKSRNVTVETNTPKEPVVSFDPKILAQKGEVLKELIGEVEKKQVRAEAKAAVVEYLQTAKTESEASIAKAEGSKRQQFKRGINKACNFVKEHSDTIIGATLIAAGSSYIAYAAHTGILARVCNRYLAPAINSVGNLFQMPRVPVNFI